MGRPAIVEVPVDIEANKPRMFRIGGDAVINLKTEMDICRVNGGTK